MKQRREEAPVVAPRYTYRRDLKAAELIPALGAGLAVGVAAFYVATLFLQRTPLVPGPLEPTERLAPRRRSGLRTEDDLPPSREGSRSTRRAV